MDAPRPDPVEGWGLMVLLLVLALMVALVRVVVG